MDMCIHIYIYICMDIYIYIYILIYLHYIAMDIRWFPVTGNTTRGGSEDELGPGSHMEQTAHHEGVTCGGFLGISQRSLHATYPRKLENVNTIIFE